MHRRSMLTLGTVLTAIAAGNVSAESARIDVPIMIGGVKNLDACANGKVTGLDPRGDGFLSVRSGPGGRPYREIDRLFNDHDVYLCGTRGRWYAIVYHRSLRTCFGTGPRTRFGDACKRRAARSP